MIPANDLQGLSRRRWLGLTLGAAAAAGGLWWWRADTSGAVEADAPSNAATRYLVFQPAHLPTLQALARAVLPSGAGFPTPAQAQVLQRFDEELSFVSPELQDDMQLAVRVLEYLPLTQGHGSRFSRLDAATCRSVIEAASRSRFDTPRAVASGLRLMLQFFYFGHPSVWQAIGYDGPFGKLPPQLSEQRLYYQQQTRSTHDGAQP